MAQTKAQLISGASSQSVTFNDATVSSINGGPIGGARNRIINGDMRIDQRNAGASSTANGVYTVDRWNFGTAVASKMTYGQNYNSLTPPAGFTNYMGFKTTTAYTVGATDFFLFTQEIEGYNASDLALGTASAKSFTLSFWVNSSLTGTFGVTFSNSAQNRAYPATYTISSANTWEYKTITIPGETTGTWVTNNGKGLSVFFNLGTGSTFSGTAGSWQSSTLLAPTGATSVVGTLNATWNITGVQLEAGSVATPFERRPYGTELMLAQRYYAKSWNTNVAVPTADTVSGGGWVDTVFGSTSSSTLAVTVQLPVEMRSGPTVTLYDNAIPPVAGKVWKGGPGKTASISQIGTRSFTGGTADTTSSNELYFAWTASAEL